MSSSNNNHSHSTTREGGPLLAVFDFDGTLIGENSDLVPLDLLPGLAERVRAQSGHVQWTELMGRATLALHQAGVGPGAILARLAQVRMDPACIQMLHTLHGQEGAVILIVSDANTVYIDTILQANGVRDLVHQVYTNPAHWEPNGLLRIRPYRTLPAAGVLNSSPSSPGCGNPCAVNMCKGEILTAYLAGRGGVRPRILYTGDGRNDLCPCVLVLQEGDAIFARVAFPLARLLGVPGSEQQEQTDGALADASPSRRVRAAKHYWTDWSDLWSRMQAALRACGC